MQSMMVFIRKKRLSKLKPRPRAWTKWNGVGHGHRHRHQNWHGHRESINWDSTEGSTLTVYELTLIWVWSKPQRRSKQGSWPYSNQDQDVKPQSGTSTILQSLKSGYKGHGCSLHLQNQDGKQKFRTWVFQRPMNISISKFRCQTTVRTLQYPWKP